jgi:hypothetical protein
MKFQSVFEVSKIEESAMSDPAMFLERMKGRAACEMGQKIAEIIPYEKDLAQSWTEGRPLPAPPFLYEVRPCDYYRLEFVVLSKMDLGALELTILDLVYRAALGADKPAQCVKEIMQAIVHLSELERQ